MKKSIFFVIAVAFLAIGLFSSYGYCEVPKTINFQGMLTDSDGVPLEGNYAVSFSIYDVSSGGTALWTEDQTVSVSNGIYNCILGSTTPIDLSFDEPYYLEISIEGETLSPRQTLSSTPYALNTARLEGLEKESFIYKDAQGNVGISGKVDFTDSSISDANIIKLDNLSCGSGEPEGFTFYPGFYRRGDTGEVVYTMIRSGPQQTMMGGGVDGESWRRIIIRTDGKFAWGSGSANWDTNLYRSAANTLKTDDSLIVAGNIGIGTQKPTAKLHVYGPDNNGTISTLRVSSSGQNMLFDGNEIDGDTGLYLNHNLNKNVVIATGGGKVGIGTMYPKEKLHIDGKVKAKEFITGDITFTDKTTGKTLWRMFEDEEGLYLENSRTGKVYTFVLKEVK